MACRAEAAWPAALQALAARAAICLQALDGRRGRFIQVAAFCRHRCTATALSTWGMSTYPLAAPPSRVVKMRETDEQPPAEKGAVHKLISPRGLGTGRFARLQPDARSGPGKHGRQLWVRFGGGRNTRGRQPRQIFINKPLFLVRSWYFGCGKTKKRFETRLWLRTSTGTALVEKAYHCNPQIAQSTSRWFSACGREASAGSDRGSLSMRRERRDRSAAMVTCSKRTHKPSTNAASACWMPRH